MELKKGNRIPNFKAKDSNGNDFDSKNLVGKSPFVLYFYPKDNTPGCTAQACSFRDQYEDFKDLGAEVIGVSSDSFDSHQKFAKQYKLPFILLSDSNKKIRKLFGVPSGMFGLVPGRVTYVADKEGVIIMVFDSMLATKHIPKALEAVKKLTSKSTK
jgi:peroxiredoxin Q/BCP